MNQRTKITTMSAKKFVYTLESASLNRTTNMFEFYDLEVFSSHKKIDQRIENSFKINKGWDLMTDPGYASFNHREVTLYTYKCMSSESDPTRIREMQVRYKVSKIEVK